VSSRGSSRNFLGNLLARFLPLRPCVLRGTLGYSGISRSGRYYLPDFPLRLFDATTASLAPARCPFRRLLPTTNHRNKHLARAISPYSVSGLCAPFFHPFSEEASKKLCPTSSMCRPQGLATLSTVSRRYSPWGCFSAPNAPRLSPFRALLLSRGPGTAFAIPPPLLRFCLKTFRP